MANESRTGLLLVAFVAVGAAAVLYNKQLNLEAERQRFVAQEQLHQRQLKCADDGKKFAAEYLTEELSAVSDPLAKYRSNQTAWDDPEFHYNVELATCLVRTRFVELGRVTYQHARITNLNSNKAVLESYVKLTPDPDKTDGTLKEEVSDILAGPNLLRAAYLPRADALMKK